MTRRAEPGIRGEQKNLRVKPVQNTTLKAYNSIIRQEP